MNFQDRSHAGKQLAARLLEFRGPDTVVIALPRGGVPVGYEISRALHAPLDILISKKLGAPDNPEFAMGAVTEDGDTWLNDEAIRQINPTQAELEAVMNATVTEIKRRAHDFRAGRARIPLAGKQVLLVDDGLATGASLLAAVESVKKQKARAVIVALPVAAREGVAAVRREADRVVCLMEPANFYAVGQWYDDFTQTTDEQVIALLNTVETGAKAAA